MLEAGRSDWRIDPFIHMPAALTFPIGSPFYDWMYESEPEPFMHGRRVYHARGKVLGGSSSINGQIFQRGNPLDYERWAADPGMETWDYAHCLPYFKRMETCLAAAADDPCRGHDGPAGPGTRPGHQPAVHGVLRGVPGGRLPPDRRRQRLSPGGIRPVRPEHPPGSAIERRARVPAPDHGQAPEPHGPDLDAGDRHPFRWVARRRASRSSAHGGGTETIGAGEVILAGGAINSPQLLLLSGVGPAADLEALGIPVVADLPGVGENLQDHLEVYIQYKSLQPVSMQPTATQKWRRPFIGAQWLFLRSGPGATNHFEGGGFARSNDDVAYPNLMFHFLPLAIRYDGSAGAPGHGYQVHVGPMYSDARGTVRLKSTDPHEHPALRFNYLSTEQDRREWVEAVRVARDILNQPAMAPYNGGETSPGTAVTTDDEIRDWVARDAETALHPSCTARMGVDGGSVVDPLTMRVHGLDGLRVVDASVMPYVTNAQHLRPGDDARREGGRPHPRERAAAAGARRLLPASAGRLRGPVERG